MLGSPKSHEPILMPFGRIDAELLRKRHSARRFFCGEWLGGCGKELYTRIGPQKVPHFAHHPEGTSRPITCRRSSNDVGSADHLYIRQALTRWLTKQDHQIREFSWEGTIPRQGGTCTGMTIETTKGLLIAIALRPDLRWDSDRPWPQRDAALRRSHKKVDWLFSPTVPMVKHMTRRQGYALVVDCESDGLRRTVRIGTKIGGKIPLWANLEDCKLDEQGRIWTPHVADHRRRSVRLPGAPAEVEHAKVMEPPPESRAVEAGVGSIIGFPLSISLLAVVPCSTNGCVIEAEIKSEVVTLPTQQVRIVLPEQTADVVIGRDHRVIGPALISAEGTQTGVTWRIHAQGLQAFPQGELEPLAEPTPTRTDEVSPEASAWGRLESILDGLTEARRARDVKASTRLNGEAEALIATLGATEQKRARKRLNRRRRADNRAEAPPAASSQSVRELGRILDLAFDKARAGDVPEARRLHGQALELFRSVPIAHVGAFQELLNSLQRALTSQPTVLQTRRSATTKPSRHSHRAVRQKISAYIDLIGHAIDQGKPSYAKELCKGLEPLLAGSPESLYLAESKQLAEYKTQISALHDRIVSGRSD
ncbi:hypothetical protein GT755_02425 [Herbidospora sp. NEAU-GS84]|uniref:Uncharacterized protein n=1 Tax=Herbidospora solisilvae TaxID=2696284 RepID=A0A7C9NK77_9ACTN|nr:competence protein CoiA family protein [Herbidospora solisilvae]NAS20536.1 hypothetical protein [Herbidospora solisilvae]